MNVYYTYDRELPAKLIDAWTRELPEKRQQALGRLRQPHKRRMSLLGTRLLKAGLQAMDIADYSLSQIEYPKDGKPSLPLPLDFSISHSGALVACAIARQGRVGLDIEMLRPMNAQAFRRILTDAERSHAGSDPRRFFDLWSRKEAVVKAWGLGGVWDMPKVTLKTSTAVMDGTRWQLRELELDPGYATHLATDKKPFEVTLHHVDVDDLS